MSEHETTQSLASEFAAAFSEESKPAAAASTEPAKPEAPNPPAAPAQASPENDDPNDPLAGLTPEQLLAHPKLGPAIQSWSDKAARKQIDSELAKVREATRTETLQQRETEDFDKFVKSLNKAELAAELAADEDGFVEKYTRWKEAQGQADQGEVAQAAQVYALTTIVQSTLDFIAGADLTPEQTTELETYRQELIAASDPQSAVKWQSKAYELAAARKAEKLIEGDAEERVTALANQQLAERNAGRPGALASPGRRASPLPELLKTSTRSLIEDAFSDPPPARRKV